MKDPLEDNPIFQTVMRAGEMNLSDLILRARLDPMSFLEQLAGFVADDTLVISSSAAEMETTRVMSRLEEVVTAEQTDDLRIWRRKVVHAVFDDAELRFVFFRLSSKELRKFSAA